jgi:hypothetical protein
MALNKEMLYCHCFLNNFALEGPGNQVRLKVIGKQHLLAYDDVNLRGDNIDTIKKTETLIDARKEVYVAGLLPGCR